MNTKRHRRVHLVEFLLPPKTRPSRTRRSREYRAGQLDLPCLPDYGRPDRPDVQAVLHTVESLEAPEAESESSSAQASRFSLPNCASSRFARLAIIAPPCVLPFGFFLSVPPAVLLGICLAVMLTAAAGLRFQGSSFK